jgi:ABC-type multidrug transport system ATPase subunit
MIEIKELTKIYPSKLVALDHINLNIQPGLIGLLGPNGAGKTTLLRILAGIMSPTSGNVVVNGHNLASVSEKKEMQKGLGYLPQEMNIYPDLTGYEFLEYIAGVKTTHDYKFTRQDIERVLDLVNLKEYQNKRLHTFSGGMKRRIGIAQALLGNPSLIILDEPTAGLDPQERVHLRNVLTEISRTSTIIISTHNTEDISQTCNLLAIISRGRVRFRGSLMELKQITKNHMWSLKTCEDLSNSGLTIVSKIFGDGEISYRILSPTCPHPNAVPTEPTLEESYLTIIQG